MREHKLNDTFPRKEETLTEAYEVTGKKQFTHTQDQSAGH